MINKSRHQIEEGLLHLDLDQFSGSITHITKMLKELEDELQQKGFSNITIDAHQEWSDVSIVIYGTRPETDKEYNERIKEELKAEQAKLARAKKKQEREQQKIKEAQEKIEAIRSKYNLPKDLDLDKLKGDIEDLDNE